MLAQALTAEADAFGAMWKDVTCTPNLIEGVENLGLSVQEGAGRAIPGR
jgi:hypothetical protein